MTAGSILRSVKPALFCRYIDTPWNNFFACIVPTSPKILYKLYTLRPWHILLLKHCIINSQKGQKVLTLQNLNSTNFFFIYWPGTKILRGLLWYTPGYLLVKLDKIKGEFTLVIFKRSVSVSLNFKIKENRETPKLHGPHVV